MPRMSTNTTFATDLAEVECIFYYDGPLLTHERDDQGRDWLMLLVDTETVPTANGPMLTEVWLAIQPAPGVVSRYLASEVSLREAMRTATSIYRCDAKPTGAGSLVAYGDLPEDLLPTDDSFIARSSDRLVAVEMLRHLGPV